MNIKEVRGELSAQLCPNISSCPNQVLMKVVLSLGILTTYCVLAGNLNVVYFHAIICTYIHQLNGFHRSDPGDVEGGMQISPTVTGTPEQPAEVMLDKKSRTPQPLNSATKLQIEARLKHMLAL